MVIRGSAINWATFPAAPEPAIIQEYAGRVEGREAFGCANCKSMENAQEWERGSEVKSECGAEGDGDGATAVKLIEEFEGRVVLGLRVLGGCKTCGRGGSRRRGRISPCTCSVRHVLSAQDESTTHNPHH
jgi:hypothetical protein